MPVIVRTVYTLKRCASLDEAREWAARIERGASRHKESELEIQYDPKWRANAGTPAGSGVAIPKGILEELLGEDAPKEEEPDGAWMVVVVNETMPPGAKPCADCDRPHFADDFLCTSCRQSADS